MKHSVVWRWAERQVRMEPLQVQVPPATFSQQTAAGITSQQPSGTSPAPSTRMEWTLTVAYDDENSQGNPKVFVKYKGVHSQEAWSMWWGVRSKPLHNPWLVVIYRPLYTWSPCMQDGGDDALLPDCCESKVKKYIFQLPDTGLTPSQ